jgi:hypothetical protein
MRTTKARRTPKVDDKRLLAYAAAAGAALAAAAPADASIIHTVPLTNTTVTNVHPVTVTIGGLNFSFNEMNAGGSYSARLKVGTSAGNIGANAGKAAFAVGNSSNILNLPYHNPIPFASNNWSNGNPGILLSFGINTNNQVNGAFANKATGYIGIRIGQGNYNYGWIQINPNNVSGSDVNSGYTIKDWAYETEFNKTILAGDTGTSAVPEPSTLALLALGAGGLAVMRRRKQTKQA